MVDDVLRMRATIASEQALGEMRKIQRALTALGTDGSRAWRTNNQEATKYLGTLKVIGAETAGTLLPAMMQLGSRAGVWGTIAAGVVAAGVAVKKASTALVEMNASARTLGITVGAMRAMTAEAEKFGVRSDLMASSVRTFSDNMTQLKYRTGSFYEEMQKLGKHDLLYKLRQSTGDLTKQIEILQEHANEIERQRGPGEAALFREKSGLARELASIPAGQLAEAVKNQSKAYDELMPKALAVNKAYIEARDAAERTAISAAATATSWERIIELMGRIPVPGIPGLPLPGVGRQHGGPVGRGLSYLVGERGPEIFSPGTSGGIFAGGGGGGGSPDEASRIIQRGVFDALVQFQSYIRTGGGEGGAMNAGFGGSAGAAAGGGFKSGGGYTLGGDGAPSGAKVPGGGVGTGTGSNEGGKGQYGWWTPERQQEAIDHLKKNAGLSDEGAKGLVARWAAVESTQGGPNAVNPKGGASGIAQWLGSRKSGFKMGDFQSQLDKAANELNTTEKRAGDLLRAAKTPEEAARGATAYERAEGYNRRTDTDQFTNKSLRAHKNMGTAAPNGQQKGARNSAEAVVDGGGGGGDRFKAGRSLAGTDPRIKEIVTAAARGLPPGYTVQPTSGFRGGKAGGPHAHGAVDWQIIRPDGTAVRNRGEDESGLYTTLARNAYGYQEKHYPGETGNFNWGGAHGTSSRNPNEPDLMHYDFRGRRGRISRYSRERIGATYPPAPTARMDGAVDSAAARATATGNVKVDITSNGTAARAKASVDGDLFQKSTVTQNKTMTPTEAPESGP